MDESLDGAKRTPARETHAFYCRTTEQREVKSKAEQTLEEQTTQAAALWPDTLYWPTLGADHSS